jgi:hypothetical protein
MRSQCTPLRNNDHGKDDLCLRLGPLRADIGCRLRHNDDGAHSQVFASATLAWLPALAVITPGLALVEKGGNTVVSAADFEAEDGLLIFP